MIVFLPWERGCPEFPRTLLTLAGAPDPRFSGVRSVDEYRSTWHLQVGPHVLPLDSCNLEAMAAAMPIFLAGLLHEFQHDLAIAFAIAGMYHGIEKLFYRLKGALVTARASGSPRARRSSKVSGSPFRNSERASFLKR